MPQDPALVVGPLDEMRRHRFVTSWVLDIPDVTGNAVTRAALNAGR
jgi:hypothetical protein